MSEKIRLGIIGVGNMGWGMRETVSGGKCPDFELRLRLRISIPRGSEWAKEEHFRKS